MTEAVATENTQALPAKATKDGVVVELPRVKHYVTVDLTVRGVVEVEAASDELAIELVERKIDSMVDFDTGAINKTVAQAQKALDAKHTIVRHIYTERATTDENEIKSEFWDVMGIDNPNPFDKKSIKAISEAAKKEAEERESSEKAKRTARRSTKKKAVTKKAETTVEKPKPTNGTPKTEAKTQRPKAAGRRRG